MTFWRFIAAAFLPVVSATFAQADVYEPDDSSNEAIWLGVNGPAQSHIFDSANDDDWCQFFAAAGSNITIQTTHIGGSSDTEITLYQSNGTTEVTTGSHSSNAGGYTIQIAITTSGFYYVQIVHPTGVSGAATSYSVSITLNSGSFSTGELTGTVFDNDTTDPIPNATVMLTDFGDARTVCDANGVYVMVLPVGMYSVQALAEDYDMAGIGVTIQAGQSTGANFFLNSTAEPGDPADINDDGAVNAVDVQLVINAALGLTIAGDGDVNGDDAVNAVDVQLVILAALGVQ